MRKFTLLLLCAGIATAANAQKNSVLLFGDLTGGMSTKSETGTTDIRNSFNIMPGAGYQFSDHWTAGIEAAFNYNGENTTTAGVSNKTHDIGGGGGLFARYSMNITPLLYFYTQADALYTSSSSYDGTTVINGTKANNFSLNFTPVIGINIKNGYGLNFGFGGLGYKYTNTPSTKTTESSNTSAITYSFGSAFTIGISKNFIHKVKKPEGKPIEDMGGSSDQ